MRVAGMRVYVQVCAVLVCVRVCIGARARTKFSKSAVSRARKDIGCAIELRFFDARKYDCTLCKGQLTLCKSSIDPLDVF